MPDGAVNTGSAEAGAMTAGGADAGSKNAGAAFNESTIPDDVRQRFIDQGVKIGIGKERERAEKQYDPYVKASEIFLMEDIDDATWDQLAQLPGFAKRLSALQGAKQEAAREGDSQALKRLDQLEQRLFQSEAKSLTAGIQERIKKFSDGDEVKKVLLETAVARLTPGDQQKAMQTLSTWGDDHWNKLDEWANEQLTKRDEAKKSEYLTTKHSHASKGAEGTGGTPTSPEQKGPVGDPDLGFDDPDFAKLANEALGDLG